MKKILKYLMLLLLCASASTAEAQLRYGFRFGGDIAAGKLSEVKDASMRNGGGFSGGLDLEYQMPTSGLAADIALLYTRFNTRLKEEGKSPESFGRNFIEVPLHFKYKFWLKSVHDLVAPMIYTGPSIFFKVGNESYAPLTSKKVQPGWDLGIGFDVINFIQITGGYRFGLGNAVKEYTAHSDAVLRTNAWNISVTLLFDF